MYRNKSTNIFSFEKEVTKYKPSKNTTPTDSLLMERNK
jgi:hypothetical protein